MSSCSGLFTTLNSGLLFFFMSGSELAPVSPRAKAIVLASANLNDQNTIPKKSAAETYAAGKGQRASTTRSGLTPLARSEFAPERIEIAKSVL
jgi:hypothetical protein